MQLASGNKAGAGRARRESGLTLLEVVIALAIMIMTLLGFSRAIVSSMRALAASRESTAAAESAQQLLHQLGSVTFADITATYNATPGDDPGGAGTAPGNSFTVPGLTARDDDPDGMVGEVLMPLVGAELREDVNMPQLGMPRDLNGDGVVDGLDHSGDYVLLPVLVRVEWSGATGSAKVEFKSVMGPPL